MRLHSGLSQIEPISPCVQTTSDTATELADAEDMQCRVCFAEGLNLCPLGDGEEEIEEENVEEAQVPRVLKHSRLPTL